jgi:hypothetical protein
MHRPSYSESIFSGACLCKIISSSRAFKYKENNYASQWMELEKIILSEVSQAQKKSHVLPHKRIRPKTNAVILLDMGHILRGECTQE